MPAFLIYALIGILGGLSSGLFGVGGGLVFVPLLVMLKKMDLHQAIGTSIAIVIPTSMMSTLRHANAGNVDWKAAACVTLFALAGAWVGSSLSIQMDAVSLRRFYAIFLLGVAAKLFFQK
ncbi:MAG: sulfite exporter TauE/SafE family protein [Candidatus Omnitrophica bacterium]|nr:sulfite exporter TauE/SafE family protein [Candidatus Omnitrophota bacterium]